MTDDDILNKAHYVFQKEINGLQKAKNAIDINFVRAVKILFSAEKIIVCGLGKSGIIGQKIAATLTSIGKTAIFIHPVEALHGDIGTVKKGSDAVIFLSNSGTTAELIRLLPHLRKRNVPIIAIVGSINSPLAHSADIALDCSVEEEAVRDFTVPTASTTAALAMGDALAVAVMQYMKFTSEDFAESHPLGQIGRNLLLTVADIMHTGNAVPHIAPNEDFRNVLIEMTAKGLGCVCIIDSDNTLVGIITDGDVRRLLQHTEDIRSLKAKNCMTINPVCISPQTILGQALTVMENRPKQLSVLPVVDSQGQCVGVVRIHDIIRAEL